MIGYIILGTNDLDRAVAYYDKLLTELGASRFYTGRHLCCLGNRT
jgi:hypothetical protein